MKPYYDRDGITIWHGDSRAVLPGLQGDVVLTDLPYGNGTDYGQHVDTQDNLGALVADVLPLMLDAAPTVLITPGVANMHHYPAPKWTLCWFDPGGTGSGPWGFCTWQPVLCYGKDPYLREGRGRRPDGKCLMVRQGKNHLGHPCPKPLDVMRWLVGRAAPTPGRTFIDPFMGAGSTLIAAAEAGHDAVGIEIEERFCEIAAARLDSQSVAVAA